MTGSKLQAAAPPALPAGHEKPVSVYVTLTIADQLFGIPVMEVSDILGPQTIASIPLASPEIAGALNLRGRIVTAVDMRVRLGLPRSQAKGISVVVDHQGELYSLIADRVGEVMSLSAGDYERNPPTLSAQWREVSNGVYRLHDQLLIVLDIGRFLRVTDMAA